MGSHQLDLLAMVFPTLAHVYSHRRALLIVVAATVIPISALISLCEPSTLNRERSATRWLPYPGGNSMVSSPPPRSVAPG